MARVAAPQINSVGNPYAGWGVGPRPGNFGISGPNVPMVSWAPRGDTTAQTSPAGFLRYGQAPTSHGHIALKSIDFYQVAFLCPPWADGESDKYIMPEMLVWAINRLDADEASTVLLTLGKLNQVLHDARLDYENEVRTRSDPETVEFDELLRKHGERRIEEYHAARRMPGGEARFTRALGAVKTAQIKRLYELAQHDMLCWNTRFGIMQRVTFQGSVINVNRGTGLEEVDNTEGHDHFTVVNVCVSRRARIANVFGQADRITTGSKLWLTLTRNVAIEGDGRVVYKEFRVIPGGCTILDRPNRRDVAYIDAAGKNMDGYVWPLGVVIEPGRGSPQPSQLETAANIGITCSERNAYNTHATLPSLTVNLQYKL